MDRPDHRHGSGGGHQHHDHDGNLLEIIDLAHSLRQEHLYTSAEQKLFRTLNATLATNASNVAQLAWICAQQRQNLNGLIVGGGTGGAGDGGPAACCRRAAQLAHTRFVEAHKAGGGVKYQHVLAYIELFNFLHRSPYLLAQALAVADRDGRLTGQQMASVVHTIVSGLYGNAIMSKDVDMLLRLLRELIEIQIVVADDPRRLLRSGASAFSRLYHRLHESLFSAKLFLTSALHESIMRVLIEDDQPLDVDPLRTIANLPAAERQRRFGLDGTGEYVARTAQYRAATLRQLHRLSAGCIQSLLDNWTLFPSTLRWVVQTMGHLLRGARRLQPAEINHILTDMVFTHFICPAVVSPDLFGLTDAPVSENARHNLIQIGQVMQMLALARHEPIDGRFADVLAMFEHNVVADLMEQLQETEYDVSVSMMAIPHQNDFGRDTVLVTQAELGVFVGFLRGVLEFDGLSVSGEDRRRLGGVLDRVPDRWEEAMANGTELAAVAAVDAAAAASSTQSPQSSANRTRQNLIALGRQTKTRLAKTMSSTVGGGGDADAEAADEDGDTLDEQFEQVVLIIPIAISDESKFQLLTEQEVLSMNNISAKQEGSGGGMPKDLINGRVGDDDDDDDDDDNDEDDDDDDRAAGSISNPMAGAVGGIGSLLLRGGGGGSSGIDVDRMAGGANGIGMGMRHRAEVALQNRQRHHHHNHHHHQHHRFDDQSIGTASDNLEAVSEVPSNHSVTSSVEMEEHYHQMIDNLSDMVSANVSGRGSPNISGRDTPSSQVTDGGGGMDGRDNVDGMDNEMAANGGANGGDGGAQALGGGGGGGANGTGGNGGGGAVGGGRLPNSIQMAKMLNKTRSDIDDKFCKFEIAKRIRGDERGGVDETVSIVSDTWSTDVLASDSETLETASGGGGGGRRRHTTTSSAEGAAAERNFSTPLIPSAVVLPGDRDFEAGALLRTGSTVDGLFDVSETRSESAWSTDVLASDSEKLIEIDTDDCGSVTANSDAGDGPPMAAQPRAAGRHPLLARFAQPAGNAAAVGASAAQPAPIDLVQVASQSSTTSSSSSSSSSAAAAAAAAAAGASARVRIASDELSHFLGPPAAVASTSGVSAMPKALPMRRQNSAESSISTQSSCNENDLPFGGAPFGGRCPPPPAQRVLKTDTNITNPFANSTDDEAAAAVAASMAVAVNSSSGGGAASDVAIRQPVGALIDLDDDDLLPAAVVEHRVVSAAQRSTSYDGRRNGIMSPKSAAQTMAATCSYDNHEIIFKQRAASMNDAAVASVTDDDKSRQQQQQQQRLAEGILVGPTQAMSLVPSSSSTARYTGTIPKSISFDESANKRSHRSGAQHSEHHHQHQHNYRETGESSANGGAPILRHSTAAAAPHGNGFFNKLKQGFRNRRSHHGHGHHSHHGHGNQHHQLGHANGREQEICASEAAILGADALLLEATTAPVAAGGGAAALMDAGAGDDILAKYRRKISSSSEATNSDSLSHHQHRGQQPHQRQHSEQTEADSSADNALLDETPMLLNNAKRKLRLVLSTTDLHTADFRHTNMRKIPPLMTYLQIQLAQALNLQHLQQIAFISETIRCLRQLDETQQRALVADLRQDLVQRQSYLQYLMRYRQHLLSALENIDRFEDRLRNDRDQCNRHLIMVCVRLFLERRQPALERFQTEFGALTVVDEKIDCMAEFMARLMAELAEFGGVLQGMTAWQRGEARDWIERALLQKLYRQVMFPNEDADVSRDDVLRVHIDKLSRLITPAHPSLRIPHEYRVEAPWPFAQQQIAQISAYKTPREKVACVVRCITSIMNLLQMATSRAPAADDLVPVLIFVVIKANPPYLMSTIQYVNAFIGDELAGEDHYWWTQFSAAVTFIKTMDYDQ